MAMTDETKRETLTLLGAGAAGAMISGLAGAQNVSTSSGELRSAMSSAREPKPLPFDPAKLNGLSEKLIRSHWENNYIGSVKTLNMIAGRLQAAMNDPDLPPVVYGGLKREELHRVGSVILHEQYFGNLGGSGKAGGLRQLRSMGGRIPAHRHVARRRFGLVCADVQRLHA
jgi:superoxide dismutase, Fe-Mn family